MTGKLKLLSVEVDSNPDVIMWIPVNAILSVSTNSWEQSSGPWRVKFAGYDGQPQAGWARDSIAVHRVMEFFG